MSDEHRLPPVAILLRLVKTVPQLIVPLLAGSIATGEAAFFAGLGLLVGLGAGVAHWARFRWQVSDDALVIREGLVTRRQRILPLERIQAVELVRPLTHRVLGVVRLRIEAAGSGAAEGQIDALSLDEARRLRAVLLREPHDPDAATGAAAEEPALVHTSPATLVLAGATGGRVGVVAALLGSTSEFWTERFRQLFSLPVRLGLIGTLILVTVGLFAVFLLALGATVVAYWGFTLRAGDDALLVRRGLLEQRLDTLPLRRLQALTVEENLLRRLIGRATVRVVIAGRPGDEAQLSGVLLPLGRRAEALALVERVLRVHGLAGVRLARMPARARLRRLLRAAVATVVVTVPLAVWLGPRGLLALVLLAPLGGWALAAYAALGHGEHAGVLVARSGAIVRRTSFVPVDRLQSLALSAGVVQRGARLTTLALQIPGGRALSDPRWIDLDRQAGEDLLDRLAAQLPAL